MSKEKCKSCGGTGEKVTYFVDPERTGDWRPVYEKSEPCPECKGTGVIDDQ